MSPHDPILHPDRFMNLTPMLYSNSFPNLLVLDDLTRMIKDDNMHWFIQVLACENGSKGPYSTQNGILVSQKQKTTDSVNHKFRTNRKNTDIKVMLQMLDTLKHQYLIYPWIYY